MNEFIPLVIKTIAETVTDLTEQQRSEIKYALEQAIELYNKDIIGKFMNEFILLAINDYFDSINWDNPDIMLSTQQYNRLSHMLGD